MFQSPPKEFFKTVNKIVRTREFDEFFKASKELLQAFPVWFYIEQNFKDDPEKQARELFSHFQSAPIALDDGEASEAIKDLGKILEKALEKNNCQDIAGFITATLPK